jgi:lytic cellulose monooxygenase (C1-hydroxylating)
MTAMLFTKNSQAQDAMITFGVTVAALALLPTASAHGYVSSIIAGGKTYAGSNPSWWYLPANQITPTAGWFALNQDNGFVSPSSYASVDIACHKSAKSGNQQVPVAAGSTISLIWNTWPDSHHGPVINYLAQCPGNCTALADASALNFAKIDAVGLVNDDSPPGVWGSDTIVSTFTRLRIDVTIMLLTRLQNRQLSHIPSRFQLA